jgi:hypothetical protein
LRAGYRRVRQPERARGGIVPEHGLAVGEFTVRGFTV